MAYYVVQQFYCIELPDKPINLWRSGELWDLVSAEEGAKVEVFGGDLISIQGAPRPFIPDTPRPWLRSLREAYEEMETLRQERREAWEEEHSDVSPTSASEAPRGSGRGT
ncbi:hypothetical protein OHR68_26940 [Spirillospora sp. NBC_00431]